MGWQYRVLHDPDHDEDEPYRLVEAFYDEETGELTGWSDPHPLQDQNIHGLIGQIMVLLNSAIEARSHQRDQPQRVIEYGDIVLHPRAEQLAEIGMYCECEEGRSLIGDYCAEGDRYVQGAGDDGAGK